MADLPDSPAIRKDASVDRTMTSPFLDWLPACAGAFGREPGRTIGLRAGFCAATFPAA